MNDIAEAASVLLARGPGSHEWFVVRRSESLRFFGGYIAFPGGRTSPGDDEFPMIPSGRSDGRRGTAARELFEETGVLLARHEDGSYPAGDAELAQMRRATLAGDLSFEDLLKCRNLRLHHEDFTSLGSLVTPSFAPIRFDTTFFVAHLPPGQEAEVWPGELAEGRWTTAAGELERWIHYEDLITPPTLIFLQAMRDRAAGDITSLLGPLLAARQADAIPPIWFAPGVQMIPLRTLGLPPSTHTNAYLIGDDPAYLLDPGPAETDEQQCLWDVLDQAHAEGRRLAAILLSHQHRDHIGAAAACSQKYGLPIWAHPYTAQVLRGSIDVARQLHDGDRIELGTAPDGWNDWHLEVLHTPGHAAGHLSFLESHYRLIFAGDMVSTLSSIIIAPPDGDLTVYLESLRRLQGYGCRLLLPSHGNPDAQPEKLLKKTIKHRLEREEQLLQALAGAARSVSELTTELYKGVPVVLLRFAEIQVLAGLRKLQREGHVKEETDGQWSLCG